MKILVAVDGSPNSNACLRSLSARKHLPPTIIHVIAIYEQSFVPHKLNKADAQRVVTEALEYLKLEFDADTITTDVINGHISHTILDVAQSWQADAIFMGAHRKRGWSESWQSSVTREVLIKARCSVVAVKADNDGIHVEEKRHLLCVDDTAISEEILSVLKRRVWKSDSEFLVLHVLEPPLGSGSENPKRDAEIFLAELNKRRSEMEQTVENYVQSLKDLLPNNAVEGQVIDEIEVVETVLKVADRWKSDLIILGTHDRRGMDKFWLGSVSQVVAARAHCSVEIIRTKDPVIEL